MPSIISASDAELPKSAVHGISSAPTLNCCPVACYPRGIMVYQLRTYWAAPGRFADIDERFRTLTMRIFARHGMQVVGFWTPTPRTEESGDLVYLLAFPDQAACDAAWDAFRADPEWQAGRDRTEANGPIVAKITSVMMQATDYSPLR